MAHAHDHSAGHGHAGHSAGGGHHHHHGNPARHGRAFVIAIALMTDAGHNLSDVLGLLLAWGALLPAAERGATASR